MIIILSVTWPKVVFPQIFIWSIMLAREWCFLLLFEIGIPYPRMLTFLVAQVPLYSPIMIFFLDKHVKVSNTCHFWISNDVLGIITPNINGWHTLMDTTCFFTLPVAFLIVF